MGIGRIKETFLLWPILYCLMGTSALARVQSLPTEQRLVVPYYMQGVRNWCGPASLAMALKYVGVDAEIWEIASGEGKVSEPCDGAMDLLTCFQSGATSAQDHAKFVSARFAARDHLKTEIKTYWLLRSENQLKEQIKEYIAQGYPVMLMSLARLHWIVITGYNAQGVWYHDPSGAFNPGCGRDPKCLMDAFLPWDAFMATLRSFGVAQLQLFVVQKKEWKSVPAEVRARPKPTVQILPELWWDSRDRNGYGTCRDCFVESEDGRDSIAFTFLHTGGELAQYRRLGFLLRAQSGARPVQKPWGAAVHKGDRIRAVFAIYGMTPKKRYAVSVKLVDAKSKWSFGFSSDAAPKKFSEKMSGNGLWRMWTSVLPLTDVPSGKDVLRFTIALKDRKTGQTLDQIVIPLKIQH